MTSSWHYLWSVRLEEVVLLCVKTGTYNGNIYYWFGIWWSFRNLIELHGLWAYRLLISSNTISRDRTNLKCIEFARDGLVLYWVITRSNSYFSFGPRRWWTGGIIGVCYIQFNHKCASVYFGHAQENLHKEIRLRWRTNCRWCAFYYIRDTVGYETSPGVAYDRDIYGWRSAI